MSSGKAEVAEAIVRDLAENGGGVSYMIDDDEEAWQCGCCNGSWDHEGTCPIKRAQAWINTQ